MRRLRLTLPTIASGLNRLAQFGVILVISRIFSGIEAQQLVAGIGLLAAASMITESGATSYLLSHKGEWGRRVFTSLLRLHVGLSLAGAAVAVLLAVRLGGETGGQSLGLLCALAVAQVIDGTLRPIRAPLLAAGKDAAYALPDLVSGSLRLVLLVITAVTAAPWLLYVYFVPSLIIAALTLRSVFADVPDVDDSRSGLYRATLQYGLGGALSATYSQGPLIVASLVLPVGAVAALAIGYRIVQPVELVPATVAQQLLPRIRSTAWRPLPFWLAFTGLGVLVAALLWALAPLLAPLFDGLFPPSGVFAILLASIIPKFGNYLLTTWLLSHRRAGTRLIISGSVGAATVLACILLIPALGVVATATITLGAELVLMVVTWIAVLAAERRKA